MFLKPEVIPHRLWRNRENGRTASVYGAIPFGKGWEQVTDGWTILWGDGTVGLPFSVSRDPNFDRWDFDAVQRIADERHAAGFPGFNQG